MSESMNENHEHCDDCGEVHGAMEVPFIVAATARLVVEKALNMTLDPNNPLNQILVMGAGMVLEGIQSGSVKEQEIDMATLFSDGGSDE